MEEIRPWRNVVAVICLLCTTAFAQEKFEIKNASKHYDAKIEVEKCDDGFCEGRATYSLFRKGEAKPFQVFRLPDTSIWLNQSGQAQANVTLLYDEQSALNFGDFNFDGFDDLALCDGKNGGYGGPSYQVYLFSPSSKRFVRSPSLSDLGQGAYLGMFEVDRKKKVLRTFSKSGCCWHQTEEFRVVNNRPRKVLEVTEDAAQGNGKVAITTRTLVGGRWKKSVRYEKMQD